MTASEFRSAELAAAGAAPRTAGTLMVKTGVVTKTTTTTV